MRYVYRFFGAYRWRGSFWHYMDIMQRNWYNETYIVKLPTRVEYASARVRILRNLTCITKAKTPGQSIWIL